MCVICSHGTFNLRNQRENEVIYVGETITLECRAPSDVRNPRFRLLDSQNNVAVDRGFTPVVEGHFGYPSQGGRNFQIDIDDVSQMRYSCEISGEENFLITEEINLNVFPRISPVCFVNTSTSLIPGEIVELSCYHELTGVLDSEIEWRQILKNGSVKEQLTSDYSSLINSFKRKYSTHVRASISDDGSKFECVIMDSGAENTCTTGVISVQNNQEVELMFSGQDIFLPLDKGDNLFVTCSSSDSNYIVSWRETTGYQDSEVIVSVINMDTIFIAIPINTVLMSGTVLNFVCMASREGNNIASRVLTVNVLFASVPIPSTTTAMAASTPLQVMLIFSPDTVPPLDRGDIRIIECASSDSSYDISWVNTVDDAKAVVDVIGNTIIVSIPMDTTLVSGDVLNFVCLATLSGVTVSRPLTIDVIFTSTTTNEPIYPSTPKISTARTMSPIDDNTMKSYPDNEQDTNGGNDLDGGTNTEQDSVGTDFTIFIVIAGVVAVILVAIIVIILIAICMTKQADHLTQEERKFGNAAYDSNDSGATSVRYTSVQKISMNDPGPNVVPYNDVSRERHVIEIDEDEIYDDSKDWRSSSEL
ncbi:hypothetical protein HOLleu_41091 [Holothuria leucospilota]|uniref:Ig-like domain-containing protein n=1 Tax=Holothuria leucospilota TaxID=206669 RepID=A0A9Q1BAE8_HOLLE|nr:hypothetical protein HOLleu_41091 [Holothuria leucospilota]